MPKINRFWMVKSDQINLVPAIKLTVEKHHPQISKKFIVVGFQIEFLTRWCAIEFIFPKGGSNA